MRCIICDSSMDFYFSKTFDEFGLSEVDYLRCKSCGFCASETHFNMTDESWSDLNDNFHSESHLRSDNPYNRNQRYFNQALMLSFAARKNLVSEGSWLDWGCGIGKVSMLLDEFFGIELKTYDKYYTPHINEISESELASRSFDLVLNTAVFEHVRSRTTLDEIESYVAEGGCFAIHTLVPERVPKDPDWMYLLPVHCAFHTNKSMQLLMDQWGYQCSAYNEHAKMWMLFRQKPVDIASIVGRINDLLGWEYLHFKAAFMDYWK